MLSRPLHRGLATAALLVLLGPLPATAEDLPALIAKVKPSVVGVGGLTRGPRTEGQFSGTGFVVGDGNLAVTNVHVSASVLGGEAELAVFVPRGRDIEFRTAKVVASDDKRDVTVLRFEGPPLPALPLADSQAVREGESIAVTGYPIGTVLGLHASTHTGIVAGVTPIAIRAQNARELSTKRIAALREPFDVFQLDITVYPGHSGSPVLDTRTGEVIAVISGGLVKDAKEDRLANPSAIAYAIPSIHVRALLNGDSAPAPTAEPTP